MLKCFFSSPWQFNKYSETDESWCSRWVFENWGEIPLLIDIVNRKLSIKCFSDWPVSCVSPLLSILKSPSQSEARCIKMLVRRPIATVTSGHLRAAGKWEKEFRKWECAAERDAATHNNNNKHYVIVFPIMTKWRYIYDLSQQRIHSLEPIFSYLCLAHPGPAN